MLRQLLEVVAVGEEEVRLVSMPSVQLKHPSVVAGLGVGVRVQLLFVVRRHALIKVREKGVFVNAALPFGKVIVPILLPPQVVLRLASEVFHVQFRQFLAT